MKSIKSICCLSLFMLFLYLPFTFISCIHEEGKEKNNKVTNHKKGSDMKMFELPPLPFAENALEPIMSAETLSYHYGKHHQAYINNLNKQKEGTEFEDAGLEEIILNAEGGLFNNAAQVWNHTFFWNCLKAPKEDNTLGEGELLTAINKKFGSFEKFKEEYSKAAAGLFGSGWVWLCDSDENGLEIISTANAQTPLTMGKDALLVIDVWEHAYYIDKRNARPAYIADYWKLVNWQAVEERF